MQEVKFDVIGLCEVRKEGEAIIEKSNGNVLSYIGQTKGQKGVGFLINKRIKNCIEEIRGVSERIAVLSLNVNKQKFAIIQVYAPTEASIEE